MARKRVGECPIRVRNDVCGAEALLAPKPSGKRLWHKRYHILTTLVFIWNGTMRKAIVNLSVFHESTTKDFPDPCKSDMDVP